MHIGPLVASDHDRWHVLARGYKTFYNTPLADAAYDTAWARILANETLFGLGATVNGDLVGITHFLFHTSTWTPTVCYLQDLFVDPEVRGKGVARALIESVATAARTHGATRLYWLTHDHNATARTLYDKVAQYNNFIRYDYPME